MICTSVRRGLGFNSKRSRIMVLSSRIPFFGASSFERKVPGDVFNIVLRGKNGHKDYLVSGRGSSGLRSALLGYYVKKTMKVTCDLALTGLGESYKMRR